ncbi:DUF937 domain-containing protein [Nonomuraea sp. SBT364]|uniref:DUF937 domain-containing protein n=1 Tax=Nonomuraea sp. SBT364 TaxID=1580530 RepID=UPI00066A2E7C|nr:DUF937 domain-containing protein [Nonomuraea sp. SBT364]
MTLTDQLVAELGDPGLEQLAGMLGTDQATVREVLQAATGVIVAGMARSSEHPDGAEALRTALDEHVDADPFNGDVATLARDGQNILAHVLGGQGVDQAADALADLSGLDSAALVKVLLLLAPMIMSLLADRAERADMTTQEMTGELHRERAAAPGALEPLLAELLGEPSARTRSPHPEW